MSGISTHILDTANGRPAAGIPVCLYRGETLLTRDVTDSAGRIPKLLPPSMQLEAGVYRLVFDVRAYFPNAFFPNITIAFEITMVDAHHHVPLLLSPFGYSTYRGS